MWNLVIVLLYNFMVLIRGYCKKRLTKALKMTAIITILWYLISHSKISHSFSISILHVVYVTSYTWGAYPSWTPCLISFKFLKCLFDKQRAYLARQEVLTPSGASSSLPYWMFTYITEFASLNFAFGIIIWTWTSK